MNVFYFKKMIKILMYIIMIQCSAFIPEEPDLIIDGCEPPFGGWELNSGPLEEQSVLLTSEPSLQPSSL